MLQLSLFVLALVHCILVELTMIFFGWVWGWFNEIKAKHSPIDLPQVSRGQVTPSCPELNHCYQNTFTGGWGRDGLSEDKANLSPPVGFELGLRAELGKIVRNCKKL